jgi:YidC/Oxa1 family membrane protein insertase
MMFMTVIMGVMFFRVPAGLCVYFIVSSLWGIFERTVLLPKSPPPGAPGPISTTKDEAKEPKKSLFGLGENGTSKPSPKERRKQRQKRR